MAALSARGEAWLDPSWSHRRPGRSENVREERCQLVVDIYLAPPKRERIRHMKPVGGRNQDEGTYRMNVLHVGDHREKIVRCTVLEALLEELEIVER